LSTHLLPLLVPLHLLFLFLTVAALSQQLVVVGLLLDLSLWFECDHWLASRWRVVLYRTSFSPLNCMSPLRFSSFFVCCWSRCWLLVLRLLHLRFGFLCFRLLGEFATIGQNCIDLLLDSSEYPFDCTRAAVTHSFEFIRSNVESHLFKYFLIQRLPVVLLLCHSIG